MFIFLIYSVVLCWANVSNSNVSMKFAQLHYFYHKMLGWQKILCPPCPKVGGNMFPHTPLNSDPVYCRVILLASECHCHPPVRHEVKHPDIWLVRRTSHFFHSFYKSQHVLNFLFLGPSQSRFTFIHSLIFTLTMLAYSEWFVVATENIGLSPPKMQTREKKTSKCYEAAFAPSLRVQYAWLINHLLHRSNCSKAVSESESARMCDTCCRSRRVYCVSVSVL